MKKLFVALMLLLLVGCSENFGQIHTVAILGKAETDQAVMVLTDKNGVSKSIEIEYPAEAYFGDDAVYYSIDRINYQSISYDSLKKGDEINNVKGIVIYHQKNGCTYVYNENIINVYKNGELIRSKSYNDLKLFKVEKKHLYQIDRKNVLRIYDVSDDSLIKEVDVSSVEPVDVTTVNGNTYLVNMRGYTLFNDYVIDSTYVYPIAFDEIEGCTGKYISVISNNELTSYRVSFDEHSMIMDTDYEEDFIGFVDFEKRYSQWYKDGYSVINFYGYVGD